MTLRVWRHPQAKRDIIEQSEYIARDNPDAAKRFIAAAETTFLQLSRMPHMGTIFQTSDDRLRALRFFPVVGFDRYLVFYAPRENSIEIVRVLHAKRDIDAALGGNRRVKKHGIPV